MELPEGLSILFVNTAWSWDHYGISTISRSIIRDLRNLDPQGNKLKIYSTVLERDGKIKDKDIRDAKKLSVDLIAAKLPRGSKDKPDISWLSKNAATYYKHLPKEVPLLTHIVGHVPYLPYAAFHVQDLYEDHGKNKPKIISIVHAIPKNPDGTIDHDLMEEIMVDTDIVTSIGLGNKSEVKDFLQGWADEDNMPKHIKYLPGCPIEMFLKCQVGQDEVQGRQTVLLMTGERKDLSVQGIDFETAVNATLQATETIKLNAPRATLELKVATGQTGETDEWKKEFHEIKSKTQCRDKRTQFLHQEVPDIDNMKSCLARSRLSILPLTLDSPIYGVETLSAIASQTPVLLSENAGLASLLHKLLLPDLIVKEVRGSSAEDTRVWSEKICRSLLNSREAATIAQESRHKLLESDKIERSHSKFIQCLSGNMTFF